MKFFIGLHQPSDSWRFQSSFISVNRLRHINWIHAKDWIMDSGAFSTILKHKGYPYPVSEYANEIIRWKNIGNLLAAVTQDYMCEKHMLALTGLTVAEHQRLTIERYDALVACNTGVYIMPVLQGYEPGEYVSHVSQYGDRLTEGMWVGVGSVCKRNSTPYLVLDVLQAIKEARPDLKLHGFGLKLNALVHESIRNLLETADSMAWSLAARKQGRNANSWIEAELFRQKVEAINGN